MFSIVCTKIKRGHIVEFTAANVKSDSLTVAARTLKKYARVHGYTVFVPTTALDGGYWRDTEGNTIELLPDICLSLHGL